MSFRYHTKRNQISTQDVVFETTRDLMRLYLAPHQKSRHALEVVQTLSPEPFFSEPKEYFPNSK
jgi:hypothetical protein